MAKSKNPEPFPFSPDNPLAKEHEAVVTWVQDASQSLGKYNSFQAVDLKTLPSGQILLAGDPEQTRRYVMAALGLVSTQESLARFVRNQGVHAQYYTGRGRGFEVGLIVSWLKSARMKLALRPVDLVIGRLADPAELNLYSATL